MHPFITKILTEFQSELKKNSQIVEYKNCTVDIKTLEDMYQKLQQKKKDLSLLKQAVFRMEGRVAGLKYEYFEVLKHDQILAINLSGTISENITLKKTILGVKKKISKSEQELIDKYIFINRVE